MIKHIAVKNLRCIRDGKIQTAPITVLYGQNGSGKSTLMHAIAVLRNIILNPNQQVDSFFNLGFASFGGFEQIVFDHKTELPIEIEIGCEDEGGQAAYGVSLGKKQGRFWLAVPKYEKLELEAPFPYPANKQKSAKVSFKVAEGTTTYTVNWNGITAQVALEIESAETRESAEKLSTLFNSPVEAVKKSDFVHLKRGFSNPHYGIVPIGPTINTEEEVATLLANDAYLESKISHYTEQIFQRDFRIRVTPGTSLFYLRSTDKKTGLSTELVNDGSGINQVVYLLAKSLRDETTCVCLEEPEIHLHPTAVRNLARALVTMVIEEQKMMIISTHSEHFILALLSAVATGEIDPDAISCYLCTKEKKGGKFERQTINKEGQIEGGLAQFMEGELEDIEEILQSARKKRG